MSDLVKALEWHNFDAWTWWAEAVCGTYYVEERNGGWRGELRFHDARHIVTETEDFYEATAAAQSDYTTRILSALDLTGVEALETENKRLKAAFEESTTAYVAVHDDRDRLRYCLCRLLAAIINDMTVRGFPPEWSAQSATAEAFAALGVKTDRLTPEARAVLGDDEWIDATDGNIRGGNPPSAALKETPDGQ